MSNHKSFQKLLTVIPVFIAFAFLLIIPSTSIILISNNSYFDTINLVYGQPNQMNFNVIDLPNIQNIPAKKVHVGDIDIAFSAIHCVICI
jgi:hypothetical protein